MHRAERGVAIAHRMRDDAQCHQVVDLGEFLALALHLLVDGPIVLGTAVDLEAFQANAVELVGECLDGLSQIALTDLARRLSAPRPAHSSECLSQLIWSSRRWASLVLDADDPPTRDSDSNLRDA